MNFFDQNIEQEPKDRTKWLWLGIIAVFAIAVAALWLISRSGPDVSRVHAKHILIKFNKSDPVDRARALQLVNDLRERIMKGESFKKLARDYSNDEFSSPRGGDLGYQRRGMFEPAFEAYVWSAPLDQLSEVIQTSYGFHLITVVDRHTSAAEAYEMELEKKATETEKPAPAPNPKTLP
ncbi:MAG TPA: peptidylprolyl isomerase [Candidatus Bathyarchaeia archaeon]|nr:peptidylprolyl isomerase [Candidatus Bathyarchaeia archaeon]